MLRRVGVGLATVAAAGVFAFLLAHALPGDPFDTLDHPGLTADDARRTREALGLDRPLAAQLATVVRSYSEGELGVSFLRQRPVSRVLAETLPWSALLGVAALLTAYPLGIAIALMLFVFPPRSRKAGSALALAVSTAPVFLIAVLLVAFFHRYLGWLPATHAAPIGGGGVGAHLRHLVLPTAALSIPAAATIARYQLAIFERERLARHVRAARAAGSGPIAILVHHVLRPSLTPVLALLGLDLPILVSGAVVVESVFAWPGIGRVVMEAILAADYPLALGATTVTAVAVVLGRTLAEALSPGFESRSRS